MPRGGGSSGRSSSGGGFSSHSHSSSRSSSSHSSSYRSSSSRSSSGGGFSSRSSSSRNGSGRSPSYRSSSSGRTSGSRHTPSSTPFRTYRPTSGLRNRRSGSSGHLLFPLVGSATRQMSPRDGRSAAQKLGRRSGCLVIVLGLLLVLLLFAEQPGTSNQNHHGQIIQRNPIAASSTQLTDQWYQDDWGDWIDACSEKEREEMISDFRYFFSKTGIQPFLWILGENGALIISDDDLEEASRDRYDALFSDKGHLLIAFREYPNASGNYISGCFAGADALQVMDVQAREILLDNIDACYERSDYSETQVFGKAVRKTADAIMNSGEEESNPVVTLLWLGAFIFAFMLLAFFRGRKKEKRAADEMKQVEAQAMEKAQKELEKQQQMDERAVKCPNCGGSTRLHLKTTEKCAYCGTYIYMDEHGNAKIAHV